MDLPALVKPIAALLWQCKLFEQQVDRIILTRPAVEAGEKTRILAEFTDEIGSLYASLFMMHSMI